MADEFVRLQQDLSAQLDAMRSQLGSALEDVHERLDFAERILSEGREARPEGK